MKPSVNRLKAGLSVVVALLFFSGNAYAATTHTVKPKDTLYSIAKSYNTSIAAIQDANNMGNSFLLRAGSTIIIPGGSGSASKSTKASSTKKSAESTKTASSSKKSPVEGICRKDGADVWQGNELIACLDKGARFEVLERDEDEYKIRLPNGKVGWILDNWVTLKDARKPLPQSNRMGTSSGSNDDIVQVAMAYRGSRYTRGGMSSRSGFDCSGFVKFLYETKGISLPHSSCDQFNCGTPINKSDLKQGDIVFFSDTYKPGISHVGVYIGDNKFIHAANTQSGVKIDDLDSPYYAKRYAGARRLQ